MTATGEEKKKLKSSKVREGTRGRASERGGRRGQVQLTCPLAAMLVHRPASSLVPGPGAHWCLGIPGTGSPRHQ